MLLLELFKQAMESLKANKLRSFLTMLGIVMGVFSVITIVAIGNAAQAYIDAQFEKLGANIIQVVERPGSRGSGEALTMEDLDIIKRAVPGIKNIHAYSQKMGQLRVGEERRSAIVVGYTSQSRNFGVV